MTKGKEGKRRDIGTGWRLENALIISGPTSKLSLKV